MGKVIGYFCVLWLALAAGCVAQRSGKASGVQWMDPEGLASAMQQEERPILVKVYTDWCQYCRLMDQTTWRSDSVAGYLAKHFYATKLNAEDRKPVSWMGENFDYSNTYKVNMLAARLLQGNMVYPSTVVIMPGEEPVVLKGALSVSDMEAVLRFFDSGAYKRQEWEDFRLAFRPVWK